MHCLLNFILEIFIFSTKYFLKRNMIGNIILIIIMVKQLRFKRIFLEKVFFLDIYRLSLRVKEDNKFLVRVTLC